VTLPTRLQPPLRPHDSRPFRLYHDRDNGINYLSCLIHGRQTGPISQLQAEEGHLQGRQCPVCVRNIEATGQRNRAP
jgi:hypothetical protein